MIFIDNQEILENVCASLNNEEIVSIDTEFERRYTYFAKLSIIQIVSKNHEVIIDFLSNLNLDCLKKVLNNDKILKLIHSAREDLEILYRLFNELPRNIFDTQIAAHVCGLGQCVSYSDLCFHATGIRIDKTHQKSDWLIRPLNEQMIEYAINDARYLEKIYHNLQKTIIEKGLQNDLNDQMQILTSEKNYIIDVNRVWRKVNFRDYSSELLSRMKILAAFREECAAEANIPRRHFLSDRDLERLCKSLPISEKMLSNLRLRNKSVLKDNFKNKLFNVCAAIRDYKLTT